MTLKQAPIILGSNSSSFVFQKMAIGVYAPYLHIYIAGIQRYSLIVNITKQHQLHSTLHIPSVYSSIHLFLHSQERKRKKKNIKKKKVQSESKWKPTCEAPSKCRHRQRSLFPAQHFFHLLPSFDLFPLRNLSLEHTHHYITTSLYHPTITTLQHYLIAIIIYCPPCGIAPLSAPSGWTSPARSKR